MATAYTSTTFSSTYKDDFKDSNNFHKILFNSGKTLQARELTQSQTIIQKEIERIEEERPIYIQVKYGTNKRTYQKGV